MINKLRNKFILLIMISMAAVLFVIIGSINMANFIKLNDDADAVLSVLASNNGSFPKPTFQNGKPVFRSQAPGISVETPFETRYFTATFSENGTLTSEYTGSIAAVSSVDAANYAQKAMSNKQRTGYIGYYKYLKSNADDGKQLIIFVYRGRELFSFRTFLATSVVISAVGILAVFLLVLFFSKRIVRPVAESYEKQKRFITDASHEIKTPLTIIDVSTEVLELEQGENRWTGSIRNQVHRLASLTENLISLTRMDEESNRLDMAIFSLSDAVLESALPFLPLAESRGKKYTLQIEPDISYLGSEQSIRQLVCILADNAVKYSSPDGEIVLILKRLGKSITLVCKNTVVAIEKGDHDIFFDRFYRADASRNSETGGSGIGLSLARSIVAAHKGKITAKSEDCSSIVITAIL